MAGVSPWPRRHLCGRIARLGVFMIVLGIAFATFIGYLALRRRDEDHAELLWGMVVSAALAWVLWVVIMVGLGSLL